MSEKYIGEIFLFGGNFAIRNTAQCNGQLLSVAQYNGLFSIIGTTYGGDGRTTFALPDLRGRAPIGEGHGAGLRDYSLGATGGAESSILTTEQLPTHTHSAQTQADNSVPATSSSLSGTIDNPTGPFMQTSGSFTQTSYIPASQSVSLQVANQKAGTSTPSPNSHIARSFDSSINGFVESYLDSAPNSSLVDIQGGSVTTTSTPIVEGSVAVTGSVTIPDTVTVAGGQFDVNLPALNVDVQNAGASHPVDLRTPYIAMNYLIVLQGLYPSRN